MNTSELAAKMLEWEAMKAQLDALELEIKDAVLEIGKTQTVGAVRATYSAGRKSYDYQAPVCAAFENGFYPDDALDPYTEIIPETVRVDYRAACKGLGITDIPFTQSEPSVTIKLID